MIDKRITPYWLQSQDWIEYVMLIIYFLYLSLDALPNLTVTE